MLRLFVRLALFDVEQVAGMLTWPHSGFHLLTAVWVPEDDRAFATRLARYCARTPVALERLTYDRAAKAVTYRSDQSDGPTAGTETGDPLEFLARLLVPHGRDARSGWRLPSHTILLVSHILDQKSPSSSPARAQDEDPAAEIGGRVFVFPGGLLPPAGLGRQFSMMMPPATVLSASVPVRDAFSPYSVHTGGDWRLCMVSETCCFSAR